MATKRILTLYHSPASRAFVSYWLLEELGIRFQVKTVDISKGEQKSPEYLKINPSGKVPTIADGGVVVSETAAIGLYLADRYGYGGLAPRIEDPQRGAYLKWMVYSSAVLDPVVTLHAKAVDLPSREVGFGAYDEVVAVLAGALKGRRYLLGDQFSAADVVLGSVISMSLYRRTLPAEPVFVDYNAQLTRRPAYQRAADATWPPSVLAGFGALG